MDMELNRLRVVEQLRMNEHWVEIILGIFCIFLASSRPMFGGQCLVEDPGTQYG